MKARKDLLPKIQECDAVHLTKQHVRMLQIKNKYRVMETDAKVLQIYF